MLTGSTMSERDSGFEDGAVARISIAHVTKIFRDKNRVVEAVRDVSFQVGDGKFVSLIGPSGCGKSTLLRIIGGLTDATQGQVLVNGSSPAEAQQSKSIGFVFQQPALLPWLSVAANVELGLQLNPAAHRAPLSTIPELLKLVGLQDFAKAHPYQLSGGMQQRVAIARALIFDPVLLLMDEPFGALDEITRESMRYELLRIWGEARKTVLFVTHSIPEAIILSDQVIVMSPRPGVISDIIDIDLPRPRGQEMEASAGFLAYAERIKRLLRAGEGTSY
jgi:NitT/TauT family transport system ATP-binding protein